MYLRKLIIVAIAVLAVSGGVIALLWFGPDVAREAWNAKSFSALFGGAGGEESGEVGGRALPNAEDADLLLLYEHQDPVFSFRMPEGFSATAFAAEGGEVILVQGTGGAGPSTSFDNAQDKSLGAREFQIFLAPFDEEGPVSVERVKKDLPGIIMEEAQAVLVGGKPETLNPKPETSPNDQNANGVPAIMFFGRDPEIGKTREVWFTGNGYLFQITARAELDSLLGPILGTWRFE